MDNSIKFLVTGGSGFIGTNIINLLIKYNHHVINYDIVEPRCKEHFKFWVKVNLLDRDNVLVQLNRDRPDYIIHLAARTDLNEKNDIEGYTVNVKGVKNIMDGAMQLNCLKRILVASSMLVCKLGYSPKSFDDYSPSSLYGESKVLTEKIVKEYAIDWIIVRPTSIWGPWFGEPYRNFFELVIKGLYFNIPVQSSSTKTYGFVENTSEQIYELLTNQSGNVIHNYFYLGDINPLNITVWANRIRQLNNQSPLFTLPKSVLKFLALIGDILKNNFGVSNFPMNSFRYNNMTSNNIIDDLKKTMEIVQSRNVDNIDEQILKTLNWIKTYKKL